MKPIDRYLTAKRTQTRTTTFGSNSMTNTTVTEVTSGRELVVCPASNLGDRRLPTPWSYTIEKSTDYVGSYVSISDYSGGSGVTWTDVISIQGIIHSNRISFASPRPTVAYNKAVANLYDEIRGTNLNLAVDIAEFKETAGMLKGAADAIRHPLRSVVKGLQYGLKHRKFSKDAAGAWLQYAFGWAPLCESLSGLIDVTRKLENHPFKVKGASCAVDSLSDHLVEGNVHYYSNSRTRACYRIGLTYSVNNSFNATLASVTTLDPLAIAWELMPFSFLVDYFFNVGGFLASLESSLGVGLDFHSGYISYLLVKEGSGTFIEQWADSETSVLSNGSANSKSVYFNRSVVYDFPVPMPPTFNTSLSSRRLLNTAAVLRQLL